MHTDVHRRFTTEISNRFIIEPIERNKIVKSDISQDNGKLRSLNHFPPKSVEIFIDTYSKYENELEPKSLGKLMHFLLDSATSVHWDLNLFAFHSKYEEYANEWLSVEEVHERIIEIESKKEGKKIDILDEFEKVVEFQENSIIELAGLIGDMGRMDIDFGGSYPMFFFRIIKFRLFNNKADEEFFNKMPYVEKYQKDGKLLEKEITQMTKLLPENMSSYDAIVKLIDMLKEIPTGKYQTNLVAVILFLMSLVKITLECIDKTTLIALSLFEMKYQHI